ncbi:MAG: DUF1573 domain-containing protein [Planctomycetes bacterium]|nr:DUF1573 domain-containing protein [Planctomycetota bacterium]
MRASASRGSACGPPEPTGSGCRRREGGHSTRRAAAGLATLLAVLLAASQATPQGAGPRLGLDATEHDFGRIADGAQPTHVFRFRNEGGAPLEVLEVRPTCGCTAVVLSERRIAPGAEGRLEVSFDSRRRPGLQIKGIWLRTNDPADRGRGPGMVELVIRAEVINLFEIQPAFFNFAAFFREDAPVRTLSVLRTDGSAFAPEAVEVSHPGLRCEVEPLAHEGREGITLRVRVVPPSAYGPLNATVRVRTGLEAQPVLEIPVYGAVRGAVEFYPKELHLRGVAGGDLAYPVRLSVTQARGGALRVLEARVEPPVVILQPDPASPPDRAEYQLALAADAPPGVLGGWVTLLLADEETPLVRIPYFALIAPRVEVSPPALYLSAGTTGPWRVRVAAPTLVRFQVTGAEVAPPVLSAAVAPEAGGFVVELSRTPVTTGDPGGPLAATLVVHTDVAGEERVEVPIRGVGR